MDSTWNSANNPPDTCRNVIVRLPRGTHIKAFYWRAEGLWYDEAGSKRKRDAILPLVWRELLPEERTTSETKDAVNKP